MSVVNLPYLTIEPVEKNMNKSELIKSFAEQNDLSIDEASTVVTIFFDSIEEYLVNNKRVELRGFGSFKIKEYGSSIGRNPKTGEKVQVKEKKMPYFRTGKELKELLNP